MRKKFVVQQPPFVANSNSGGRPKRKEDQNNNDLDHFPGRQVPLVKPPAKHPALKVRSIRITSTVKNDSL